MTFRERFMNHEAEFDALEQFMEQERQTQKNH